MSFLLHRVHLPVRLAPHAWPVKQLGTFAMVSQFTEQFDPLAGRETTLKMVSGLPQRIAEARVRSAAILTNEMLERARATLSEHGPANTSRKVAANRLRCAGAQGRSHGTCASYAAELMCIGACLVLILVGMLLNMLH